MSLDMLAALASYCDDLKVLLRAHVAFWTDIQKIVGHSDTAKERLDMIVRLINADPRYQSQKPIARDTEYAAPPSSAAPAGLGFHEPCTPLHDDFDYRRFESLPPDEQLRASGVVEVGTRPRLPESEDEERAPSDAVFADVAREIRNVMGGGG